MHFQLKIIFLYILIIEKLNCIQIKNKHKRSLIFPPTSPTRTQFIYGIGIPLELDTESLTTGYVLKAEYFIPTKAEELRPHELTPQPIHKRSLNGSNTNAYEWSTESFISKSNKKLSKYRWVIYKTLETIINRMGFVGRSCVLQSICEVAEIPFHHDNGILGEIIHLIMSPSASIDTILHHSDNEYYHAEMLGKSGAPCSRIFKECRKSFLGQISSVYDFGQDILKKFL